MHVSLLPLVSATCLLLGVFLLPGRPVQRWLAWLCSAVAGLAIIALFALEWISNQFTDHGFDDSVIYHFRFGFEGAGIGEFARMLLIDTVSLITVVTVFFWLGLRTPRLARNAPTWLGSAFLIAGLAVHPTLPKLVRALSSAWFPTALKNGSLSQVAGFVPPQLPANRNTKLPNLVWIYAESLERTYFDTRLFPDLTPQLIGLEQQGLSLTDLNQVSGASWTIAGMVASQCGVPLVTAGAPRNSVGSTGDFLPGAVCLGDLLKAHGYDLHYLGGAALVFAGKGKFYRGHGFNAVQGRDEFAKRYPDEAAMTSWGLYDTTLFKHVVQEFTELVAAKRPFGLFTLTLDTHGLAGHSCGNEAYGDGTIDILNAVHCSDRLIANLVRELQLRDPEGNTLYIITSDHLARPNNAFALLQKGTRRNLALFLWPGRIGPAKDDTPHVTFDTGVTALRLMGFPVSALAFGRAAGADQPSLANGPDLESRMQNAIPSLLTLWNLPERLNTLAIDPGRAEAVINGQAQALPLIIGVRADGKIQKLFHPDSTTRLSNRAELLALTESCAEMKWIERCERVDLTLARTNKTGADWCLWDWRSDAVTPLGDNVTLK